VPYGTLQDTKEKITVHLHGKYVKETGGASSTGGLKYLREEVNYPQIRNYPQNIHHVCRHEFSKMCTSDNKPTDNRIKRKHNDVVKPKLCFGTPET
jgi:intein-encoded DNA endonuclease-like protein